MKASIDLNRDDTMPINDKHFDTLAYVKKSRELGVSEELAEYQARQLENVIDIASHASKMEVNARDPATKVDLKQVEATLQKDLTALQLDIRQVEATLKLDIKQLEVDLKKDIAHLDVKIEKYRYDSLKFTVWTGIGVVVSLSGLLIGLLAKGFHWF